MSSKPKKKKKHTNIIISNDYDPRLLKFKQTYNEPEVPTECYGYYYGNRTVIRYAYFENNIWNLSLSYSGKPLRSAVIHGLLYEMGFDPGITVDTASNLNDLTNKTVYHYYQYLPNDPVKDDFVDIIPEIVSLTGCNVEDITVEDVVQYIYGSKCDVLLIQTDSV